MKKARWILALLMALLMVVTTIMPVIATEEEPKPTAEVIKSSEAGKLGDKLNKVEASRFDELTTDPETEVTAIIIFGEDGANALDADQGSTKAVNARKAMANRQNEFVNGMNKKFSAELLFNYTVLADGVAVKTKLANLKEIETMEGVKAVYIANEYSVPTTETPDASVSADITGASMMQYYGFSGEGTVIAVLDTGLTTTHEAFQDYGITKDVVNAETIAASGVTVEGAQLSSKVPFSYDYANGDNDVTDTNGHGTHVAGIATGYVEAEDGAVTFYGAAPAAQLLFMKIFTDNSGSTNSGIYFAALEDAYLLGADVINMSIGSDSGFTHDYELEDELFGDIYKKLDDEGVILSISAGNDDNMSQGSINELANYAGYEWPAALYQDYGVTGSPSTYDGNQSIASMENFGYPSFVITVGGESFGYIDSSDAADPMHWLDNFANETLEYVMVPGNGTPNDFANVDVEGKIACISRGSITFEEKVENAYNAGAIGAIIYNNQSGSISMAIETFEIPAVSVQQNAGAILAAGSGSLTVPEEMALIQNSAAFTMSTFSSWGVTPSLTLKPTLTAIGGMVYSASMSGDSAYEVMSGTSMAAPNATGCFAVMTQYLRENYPELSKKEISDMVEDIMESTAYVSTDEYDYELSPRQQGAGLIDLYAATEALAYVSDPIISIGDNLHETGMFKITFDVVNMTNGTLKYGIDPVVMFPYTQSFNGRRYDTETMDYLFDYPEVSWESDWDSDVVVVEPYGTENVTVVVSFTEGGYAAEMLQSIFENGTYLEGYVYLYPLEADVEYFEVSFPEINETYWVEYGLSLNEWLEVMPEVPYMYGTRGGQWDADLDAPVLEDMEIYATYDWILYGDADCNGAVDAADAAAVLRHVVKIANLTEDGIENAMVTKEFNMLKAADAAAILRKVVRLIEEFPIETRNAELNAAKTRVATRSEVETYDIDWSAVIHATFVGFYGDWTWAPALECYDFRDLANTLMMLDLTGAANMGYTWDMAYLYYPSLFDTFGDQQVGYNQGYGYDSYYGQISYLGTNAFTYENNQGELLEYNEDRIAISNFLGAYLQGGWSYVTEVMTYPTQLRNCRHLILRVYDADTDELYWEDDTEYLPKARYDADNGVYAQLGNFGWDGYDMDGYAVPSGTRVTFEYYTVLDYEGAEENLEWSFQCDVDYDLPTIENVLFDEYTRTLKFDISDENYLAYIQIKDEYDEELYWDGYAAETRGETEHIEISLLDNPTQFVSVALTDYATNEVGVEIETPYMATYTIKQLRNRVATQDDIVVRGLINHIDEEGGVYVQSPNDEVEDGEAPWGLYIETATNEMGKDLAVGQVCFIWVEQQYYSQLNPESAAVEEATFLFSHEEIASEDIISTVLNSAEELTQRLQATRVEIPTHVDTNKANVTFTVDGDVWGDGTGYQFLLDFNASAYGDVFQAYGPFADMMMTNWEDKYSAFEMILPETGVLVDDTVSAEIEAGVYDLCIVNPDPRTADNPDGADYVWIATKGRADDFEFMAGYNYNFTVALSDDGMNDMVTLEVTDWNGNVVEAPAMRGVATNIFTETFADLTAWTQIDADGDDNLWRHSSEITITNAGNNTPDDGFALSMSYENNIGAYTPDNWLVSPQIDLTNVTDAYVGLTFYVQAQDAAYPAEVFGVGVSTTGSTDPDDFTMVYDAQMSGNGPTTRATTAWYKVEVDLSDYIGEQIYFALRHYDCTDCFYLNVDDLRLYSSDEPSDPNIDPPTPGGEADEVFAWTADSLDGWTLLDEDGDGNQWYLLGPDSNYFGHGTEQDGQVTSASYAGGALHPDNWLISPKIDIRTRETAELSFWVQAQDEDWAGETFGVYVSTTGMDTDDFELVYDATMSEGGPVLRETDWFNVTVDLSDYVGKNIYIAFRHYDCEDMFRLNIDDVYVYATGDAPNPEMPFPQVPYGWMVQDIFSLAEDSTPPYFTLLMDSLNNNAYYYPTSNPYIEKDGEMVQADETEYTAGCYIAGLFTLQYSRDEGELTPMLLSNDAEVIITIPAA